MFLIPRPFRWGKGKACLIAFRMQDAQVMASFLSQSRLVGSFEEALGLLHMALHHP